MPAGQYQRSLILSGVNVDWAGIGWRCIWFTDSRECGRVVAVVGVAALGSVGLAIWMHHARTARPGPQAFAKHQAAAAGCGAPTMGARLSALVPYWCYRPGNPCM